MSEEKDCVPEENPQKQSVNNEPTDETISSVEPIAEVEQSEIPPSCGTEQTLTLNPQPSTSEDMEVHHHARHAHGKKNWKDYFWEFLMLFLAVFCGFLAEYQLEHTIENQREKKYVHSLIEDLKADTANLTSYVQLRKEKRIMMDSLMMLLNTGMHNKWAMQPIFLHDMYFMGSHL